MITAQTVLLTIEAPGCWATEGFGEIWLITCDFKRPTHRNGWASGGHYALTFIASPRILDVLGRMMRGSTCSPFCSVARMSFPEIETGFSPG